MLHDRRYEPENDELIYHYCGATSFFGITQSRRLWFSDVFAMNDFMEMRWGYSIFEEAATELLNNMPREFLDKIDSHIVETSAYILPLVACFSLDGDVLSQWRSYSTDGAGFALGFSAKRLTQMAVTPLKVLYEKRKQIDELKAILLSLYEVEQQEGFKYGVDFARNCRLLGVDLCALKNPAFREEKEIRLVHAARIERRLLQTRLKASGGTAWGRSVEAEAIAFRMKEEIPVAYVALDFTNEGKENPLKKVVLGPKNDNLTSNIKIYLNTIGITGVVVEKSKASYV
jgi:DUF2971 family protein